MSAGEMSAEMFRALAPEHLSYLTERGFRRAPELEQMSPTGGTVVYVGQHVGFVFSLDVRDQDVGAQVVKVSDGQLHPNWTGGYSADLFMHLVNYAGYRGQRSRHGRAKADSAATVIGKSLDSWIDLLKQHGASLLDDAPTSLP